MVGYLNQGIVGYDYEQVARQYTEDDILERGADIIEEEVNKFKPFISTDHANLKLRLLSSSLKKASQKSKSQDSSTQEWLISLAKDLSKLYN